VAEPDGLGETSCFGKAVAPFVPQGKEPLRSKLIVRLLMRWPNSKSYCWGKEITG
jgi:hypothetical protein